MKKLIFNMMLLPILGFSYELDFNKSFSKIVNPDLLSINITISVEKKEENKVNSEIEKFNNFIKDTKSVTIKNGNYTLSPKYEYKDNKTEFKGYVGDLRYTAQSKDAKNINKFINDLLALKDQIKSADIKLDISNIVTTNDTVFVKDINVSDKVKVLDDPEQPIITVVSLMEETDEKAATTETPAK